MKKHFIHIGLLLAIALSVNGQVIDTTININSWLLKHNYSRFEDTRLDTTIHDLVVNYNPLRRNGIAYDYLGIIGSAARNLDLFEQPPSDFFIFGSDKFPLMATPDRTVFYNTRMPFTEIKYSTMVGTNWNEETIKFLHTQNMDPFSNIGIDFELLSGKPYYNNEETRVTKLTLFGNRTKDKYSGFGTFHFNRFNSKENGGLSDPDQLRLGQAQDNFSFNMNLSQAASNYTNMKLFYTQKFVISEKIYETDTLGVTTDSGTNVSFNHQIVAERNDRFFSDNVSGNSGGFYDNFYYTNNAIRDSAVKDKIVNTFQFILGDPYTDSLSARVYAGHEIARYGQQSPLTYQVLDYYDTLSYEPLVLNSILKDTAVPEFNNQFFNEIFVGFHLAGPPENTWYWNIDGKYYLAGYFRNNFNVDATFARSVFQNYRLGISGGLQNRNASYYHNNYSSAFFKWQNDFRSSQLVHAEVFMQNNKKRFDARLRVGTWTNYIYWDENAMPAQADKAILVLSGKLKGHFQVGGFHSINQLLTQYSTNGNLVRVPLVAVRSSNFYERDFFNDALKVQAGFDLYVTTRYKAKAYMPATGVFYLQNEETIGGFPFIDPYLGIRVKRTRIFFSFNNSLAGIISNNYFTAAGYAAKPQFFRFGVAWTFYD
ncbi:MAG TPA: putative porin [Bacteroidales bacterium]|nr:putative porin [Bacteroidales bacterium]